jgi:hypothetical protein
MRCRRCSRWSPDLSTNTALEAAVHRDLVKSGRITPQVGAAFTALVNARVVGDYGADEHITTQDATKAVANADLVIEAIRAASPEPMP